MAGHGRRRRGRRCWSSTGSSSLKLSLVGPAGQILDSLDIDPWHGQGATAKMAEFVAGLDGVGGVGHRVVHGGSRFRGPP